MHTEHSILQLRIAIIFNSNTKMDEFEKYFSVIICIKQTISQYLSGFFLF